MELQLVQVFLNVIIAKAGGTLKASLTSIWALQTWQQAPVPALMAEYSEMVGQIVQVTFLGSPYHWTPCWPIKIHWHIHGNGCPFQKLFCHNSLVVDGHPGYLLINLDCEIDGRGSPFKDSNLSQQFHVLVEFSNTQGEMFCFLCTLLSHDFSVQ